MEEKSSLQLTVTSSPNVSIKTKRISLRHSFENSDHDNLSNISPKKPRRSSARRKSLIETLQSIPNLSTNVNSRNGSMVKNVEESQTTVDTFKCDTAGQMSSDAAVKMCNESTSESIENIDDIPHAKLIFEYSEALSQELQDWKSLHDEYKLCENKAKTKNVIDPEFTILTSKESCSSNIGKTNYDKYVEKLSEFEQRFTVIVQTIKTSLKQISGLRNSQENWINQQFEKEIQQLHPFSDSQALFKRICDYNNLLTYNSEEK